MRRLRTTAARYAGGAYERLLEREIGRVPSHVAVIQDGNRRYAREQGADSDDGHRAGARTTEDLLRWCRDLGVEELTLYAFSTENFERPPGERAALFDLIAGKLREFADSEDVHEGGVQIRALGDLDRLPARVREAVDYARRRTAEYDEFRLNVALAYGGRDQLLGAARAIAHAVEAGDLAAGDVDVETVEDRLYDRPVRDVDLIVRTGGDERTSNFLPWHANGNEAAVYFCTPYWPEFSRVDFLRAVRTYERREQSWRTTRARRALTLVRALGDAELPTARRVLGRFRDALPSGEREAVEAVETEDGDPYEPAD
jgi:tritrans,polycis-undecaprenyl-diphosphate synthase [geranylgeranyl-diphosphate specific]